MFLPIFKKANRKKNDKTIINHIHTHKSVHKQTCDHQLNKSPLFDGRTKYKCSPTDFISLIMIRLIKIRVVELDYRTVTHCGATVRMLTLLAINNQAALHVTLY